MSEINPCQFAIDPDGTKKICKVIDEVTEKIDAEYNELIGLNSELYKETSGTISECFNNAITDIEENIKKLKETLINTSETIENHVDNMLLVNFNANTAGGNKFE